MKANEFVKRFGWDNSKECLRILRLRDTDFPLVCVCGDCTERDDLERLVESHDLVEMVISNHNKIFEECQIDIHGLKSFVKKNPKIYPKRLKQAIADVESCHVD